MSKPRSLSWAPDWQPPAVRIKGGGHQKLLSSWIEMSAQMLEKQAGAAEDRRMWWNPSKPRDVTDVWRKQGAHFWLQFNLLLINGKWMWGFTLGATQMLEKHPLLFLFSYFFPWQVSLTGGPSITAALFSEASQFGPWCYIPSTSFPFNLLKKQEKKLLCNPVGFLFC